MDMEIAVYRMESMSSMAHAYIHHFYSLGIVIECEPAHVGNARIHGPPPPLQGPPSKPDVACIPADLRHAHP
jgi:hypothetical protein